MNWYKTLPLSLKWRWGADLTEKVVLHKHCRLMDLSSPQQPFTLRWCDIVNLRKHPDWKHNDPQGVTYGPGLEGSAGGIKTNQIFINSKVSAQKLKDTSQNLFTLLLSCKQYRGFRCLNTRVHSSFTPETASVLKPWNLKHQSRWILLVLVMTSLQSLQMPVMIWRCWSTTADLYPFSSTLFIQQRFCSAALLLRLSWNQYRDPLGAFLVSPNGRLLIELVMTSL